MIEGCEDINGGISTLVPVPSKRGSGVARRMNSFGNDCLSVASCRTAQTETRPKATGAVEGTGCFWDSRANRTSYASIPSITMRASDSACDSATASVVFAGIVAVANLPQIVTVL